MKLSVPLSALMSEAITGFCENYSSFMFFFVPKLKNNMCLVWKETSQC